MILIADADLAASSRDDCLLDVSATAASSELRAWTASAVTELHAHNARSILTTPLSSAPPPSIAIKYVSSRGGSMCSSLQEAAEGAADHPPSFMPSVR